MNSKVKSPVKKGIANVPVVMQMEALECGAASLTMIFAYYGLWLPLEQVRYDCGVSRDGSKAINLLKAARARGLNATGFKAETEYLRDKGSFPCIIHWDYNHFVVLRGFRGNYAYINDPAIGDVKVPMEEFDRFFTGIVLFFEPGEEFKPSGRKKSIVSFLSGYLKEMKGVLAILVLSLFTTSLLAAIQPAFLRIFAEKLLPGEEPSWLIPFIIILSIVSVLQIVAYVLQEMLLYKFEGKFASIGSAEFMWKLLRMPMDFFSQRMTGDLQLRQKSNEGISYNVAMTLAPVVINFFMMILYLVCMSRISLILTAVGVAAILLNVFVSRIVSDKRINLTRGMARDNGLFTSTTLNGIEMIETLKASGAENGFFAKWAGYQANLVSKRADFAKINNYLGMIPEVISALSSVAVLIGGIALAMSGRITLGVLMTFQSYMQLFQSPAETLIESGQALQEMRTDMERVTDVMQYPIDPVFECESNGALDESADKFIGTIEFKHVTFGYSRLSEPVIKDFNMKLEYGKHIALVGPSGCGKSTISLLLMGLYEPWEGEILFDGKKRSEYPREVLTSSIAMADQIICLFEDTIGNNIKMWDSTIEYYDMVLAVRDVGMKDDIALREGSYDYVIMENGKDFSGGQRQRLEIARALAQDPTVMIMDEATSALDANTESDVLKAINERGISCLLIAHRLSTIRDCDEIIVLKNGVVTERGTHDELLSMGGEYSKLISND